MALTVQQTYNLLYETGVKLLSSYSYFSNTDIDPRDMAEVGLALVGVETGGKYDPNLKNARSSAKGLMQILKGTKESMEKNYLKIKIANQNYMFDPRYNALIGLAYLAYQYKRYGNWKKSVIAYNQGSFNTSSQGAAYFNKWDSYHSRHDYADLEEKRQTGSEVADLRKNGIYYDEFV